MDTIKLPNIIPESNKNPKQAVVKLNPASTDVFLNNKIEEETTRAKTREDELESEIKAAGKVDDVKVDGVSVVTNKVANIDLASTKEIIPVINAGTKTYKFKIRILNNKPQLVYEEI